MAGLPDADQGGFPLPRFDTGGAVGFGSGAVHGPGSALRHAGSAGVALVLLQRTDDRPGPLSGARYFHPAHEAEKHTPLDARRGLDHALGTGVLRLTERKPLLVVGYWLPAEFAPGQDSTHNQRPINNNQIGRASCRERV